MINEIRKRVNKLYESNELLGFSLFDDQIQLVHNESFVSDKVASETVKLFTNCRLSLMKAGRKVKRFTVELDDIILMYCIMEEGHVLFTLDRECDLDAAAKVITPT